MAKAYAVAIRIQVLTTNISRLSNILSFQLTNVHIHVSLTNAYSYVYNQINKYFLNIDLPIAAKLLYKYFLFFYIISVCVFMWTNVSCYDWVRYKYYAVLILIIILFVPTTFFYSLVCVTDCLWIDFSYFYKLFSF